MKLCKGCGCLFEPNTGKQLFCTKRCCKRKHGNDNYHKLKDHKLLAQKRASRKTMSEEETISSEFKRYANNTLRNRDIDFCLTENEFGALIFDTCFYCGSEPSTPTRVGFRLRNGIDRLDSTLGYTYDNCVTSCWTCNRMKGELGHKEFIKTITKILRFSGKKIIDDSSPTLEERATFYAITFPDWPAVWYDKNWLLGNWSIGNNYEGSHYHGSYPPSYLKRIKAIFPEFSKEETLHLFSGSLSPGFGGQKDWSADFPGICLDINPDLKPDINIDAEKMSESIEPNRFGIILADCPYTDEDANKYGVPLINRNKVVKECWKVLKPGGFLCWMDMVLPMYSKKEWKRVGEIAISRSTNHRVRAVFIFQKVTNETLSSE